MKKTILAVVTTSLLAASANAATVYDKDGSQINVTGRVEYAAGQTANYSSGEAKNFGGEGTARLGVDGKMATASDVTLIAKMEWDLAAESSNDNSLTSRYAYTGADFGNGVQVTVGKVDNPYEQLAGVTDIYNTFSGAIEDQFAARSDDTLKVAYAADGWDLAAAVSFGDTERDDAYLDSNGNTLGDAYYAAYSDYITTGDSAAVDALEEGYPDTFEKVRNIYSSAAGYTFAIDDMSSLKTVVAYQQKDGITLSGKDKTVSQYAAGVGYSYDAFYLGSTYGQLKTELEGSDDVKTTIWTVTGSYKVQPDLTAFLGYGLTDPHNAGGVTNEYYVLGTQYDITAKAKVYAEYKINEVSGQDDNYAVGMQYNF